MVEIGGMPILWHIMRIYAEGGFKEFVVALGYKAEIVKGYFLDYLRLRNSFTIDLGRGDVNLHECERDDWTVHLVDTGLQTQTGGRMRRLARLARRMSTFMMTYGDGVAELDLRRCSPSTKRTASSPRSRRCARRRGLARSSSTATASTASSPRSRRPAKAGSTAASSSWSREVLDYIDGDDDAVRARPARAAGRGRAARGLSARGVLAVHGHAARR